MTTKDKNKKSRCPKNTRKVGGVWDIPAAAVAAAVGCGESTVVAVRAGKRSADTEIGKRIQIADDLLGEGANLLLKEVMRVVKL